MDTIIVDGVEYPIAYWDLKDEKGEYATLRVVIDSPIVDKEAPLEMEEAVNG